jgi:NAD(P)-dependent dehydrogenase (short-subunit alcohol dehydrogenase family)
MLPLTPSFHLDGRRALVTGGSKGIGLAAAAALVQAGSHVTIVARSANELEAAVQALAQQRQNSGQSIVGKCLDVTDARAVAGLVSAQTLTQAFDILVNNAGMNRPSLISEMQDADIDAVLAVNVKAAFYVAREVVRALLASGKPGSIINLSSQMGHVGGPKRTLYCATKHAIEGMTKALAWEVGRQGIRVNSLCPTYIATDLTAQMLDDPEFRAFAEGGTALGRIGRIEEIMGAVVFLASDASSLVTGSALMVDGGWTAR